MRERAQPRVVLPPRADVRNSRGEEEAATGSVALWDMAGRSRRVVLELISTKIHPVSTPLLAPRPRPRPRPIHQHIVRLFFLCLATT